MFGGDKIFAQVLENQYFTSKTFFQKNIQPIYPSTGSWVFAGTKAFILSTTKSTSSFVL